VLDGDRRTEMEDRQLVNEALMLLETGQVDQAIETVQKIESLRLRIEAFGKITEALMKMSQPDQIVQVLDRIIEAVQEIKSVGWRDEALWEFQQNC
jgi:hypothetical protein